MNAFGEEVIIDNAEKALEHACKKTGAIIEEYTAAPRYMAADSAGCHEWVIEFEKEPSDLSYFAEVVDNALKYGGGENAPPQIAVAVNGDPERVRVTVEDHGPGVSDRHRRRIFDPFYRARYEDFAVEGTGLGLSISRRLAERLRGTLEYSTRSAGGSRFTLTLPTIHEGTDE